MSKIESIMEIIKKFDAKGDQNEFLKLILRRVSLAVNQDNPLIFTTFTCSTISSAKIFSNKPWEYVSLDPQGNNLTADIKRLAEITKAVQKVYPKTRLQIIIGNTDPYYIYTQQFLAVEGNIGELWTRFAQRWESYCTALKVWLKDQALNVEIDVVSWYEFEKEIEQTQSEAFKQEYLDVFNNIERYAKESDMSWELKKLKSQFGKGGYFNGLEQPGDVILKDWVRRKFAEYAVQALWIRQYMPNVLLIQNEKPSDLRTNMYQSLVRERCNEAFPILYFCGVDNQGYQ
ncbi:hypothetical protein KJ673_02995 [Patescibacteria group bacterium]|nr:hypothetical protein [Patescibacteria group bacterium]MCG2687454.1 hypothetical protein [Candidatus Parcubacteria bacterium]